MKTTTPASASASASRTSWRRWSAKAYILAALLGTLATLAVVAGISISLAPAHVSFTIARGGKITAPATANNNKYFNFTVVASNNISSRSAVRYGSLSAKIWFSATSWVPADAEANMTAEHEQRPGDAISFPVSAQFHEFNEVAPPTNNSGGGGQPVDTDEDSSGMNNITWPNCKVVVEAKVWFSSRLVTTRQYTIRASCYPVDFSDGVSKPVNCTS